MRFQLHRFAALMLTGVTLSGPLAHLMELPVKMTYDPGLYARLQQSLYFNYGRVAGTAEILAVLVTAALVWRLRNAPSATLRPAMAAAACLAVSHAIFWVFVAPANAVMADWSPAAMPADWMAWRNQWEYGHASRAVLEVAALAALVLSTLKSTSATEQGRRLAPQPDAIPAVR